MEEPQTPVHVSPTGENWEVETNSGTVAQTETREEAIQAARETAAEIKSETILVHNSDGSIQEQVSLPRVQKEES
jgi:hypothetical protein